MSQGCLGFEDAEIVTPNSAIHIPYISLVGNSWDDYKDFVGQVRLDAAVRNSRVSTDDAIAWFAPRLREWHVTFDDADLELTGQVADFTGRIRSLTLCDSTTLVADLAVKGLPDIRQTRFDLDVSRLRTSAGALERLALDITGRQAPGACGRHRVEFGRIDLRGPFRGSLSSFGMRAGIATDVGTLTCDLAMRPLRKGMSSIRGGVERAVSASASCSTAATCWAMPRSRRASTA